MKRSVLFLLALVGLYVAISLGLHAVYGDSYPLWPGDDYWRPDGRAGWEAVGAPGEPMPVTPSRNIPTPLMFLPFLVPGLLLAVMMLTPLGRIIESPRSKAAVAESEGEGSTGNLSSDDTNLPK